MDKKPSILIIDGLRSYHDTFNNEFYTNMKPRTEYVNIIRMSGDMIDNKMERLNDEIRDREKVMRNLKIKDTLILTGYHIYHEYIREHQGLDNKTLC